jgi:tetratricopeptide (TPR) repeat protein
VRRSARRPEPAELAAWLAGVQLDGPARAAVSLGRYAPVLGRSGVDAYRAHVLRRFAQAPGDLRARYAREDLARHERDVDGLVEVLGGTLDSAAAYTRLARALRDIGAETEAIEWAERGLRAHPDGTAAARLRQFLVERYTAGRPPAEAVAAARAAFAATPSLSGYRALHQAAKRAGAWPAERDAAREVLRSRPDDHIRALLDDGDVAAAWRAAISAEATLAGSTWDEVARRRAARRPADAIPVLRRRIGEVLDGRDRGRGPDAVQRLVELREAHERDGTAGAFADFLRELTVTYRRRPALLAELAEAGLTA